MAEKQRPEDIAAYNERSLNALDRAIALSLGEFSLVLVRCNYKRLCDRILHRLRELGQNRYSIQEFNLPPTATTLFTTLQAYGHGSRGAEEQGSGGAEERGSGGAGEQGSGGAEEQGSRGAGERGSGGAEERGSGGAGEQGSGGAEENLQPTTPPLAHEKYHPALFIFGLEAVTALDDLLASSNQVRDEFRKRLPFPLVLWVNDEVLQKLVRFAPDLTSWAATAIKFEIATSELVEFLRQKADSLFATVLRADGGRYTPWQVCSHYDPLHSVTECRSRLEIEAALQDLQRRRHSIEPELEAGLQFVFGQYDYASDLIESAIARYKQSLRFWRATNHFERQGVLLFHLGLCYCRLADLHPAKRQRNLEEAWPYLQQCVEVFEQAGHQELVAQFITQLAEVLHNLEAWEALRRVAHKSLALHQTYGTQTQLAQDYGFLAEVALKQSRWTEAKEQAQHALSCLAECAEQPTQDAGLHYALLRQLYQLFLVKAQRELGEFPEAVYNLETATQELKEAIAKSDHRYEPQHYLHLLEELRTLYFEQGQYLEAFWIKQEQRTIEQLYGFRAFIGANRLQPQRPVTNPTLTSTDTHEIVAQEIAASGRQQDVHRLIERLTRADHKLTVIHGNSGVGKSSIVSAGLVPALKQKSLGDRLALPIVLQVYTDWVRELPKALCQALEDLNLRDDEAPINRVNQEESPHEKVQIILNQLHQNAEQNLLTVLVFDQFEEFFFVLSNQTKRILFYEFLRDCLNLPFIKVVLAIREDYLHYLLELDQFNLEVIDNNILDKKIRYPLGNFSQDDAHAVIKNLTERAHFYLEPALIDQLVQDLASDLGTVRPIELQVVGAQLQAENITTLEQYEKSGPKQRLVERFLEQAIQDCGAENEHAAWLVLYLLTDENGNRPLRTRAELAIDSGIDAGKLDLILEILEKSGLVFIWPEFPTNCYQLIHDYLIEFIRQKKQLTIQTELEELRKRDKQSQDKIEQLRAEIREKDLLTKLAQATAQQRKAEEKLNQILRQSLKKARLVGISLATLTVFAGVLWVRAGIGETNAKLSALSASSEALAASNRRFDALLQSVRAARQLKQSLGVTSNTQTRVVTALQKAVYGVRERNRLRGHSDWVSSVSFSPNGELIASGSKDKTIKLWDRDGKWIKDLTGHKGGIYSVVWSPDGQMLASTSEDKTVRLWSKQGVLLKTLAQHNDRVHGLSFSPDGQRIVTASEDKTVRIWSKDGVLLKTLTEHQDWVLGVSFSPNNQLFASAGRDKTIKIWSRNGDLLKSWTAHTQPILNVSFSPDGQMLASASADNTIKLWRTDGTLIKTLQSHSNWVLSVSFSPDGEKIASVSADNTIKLWRVKDQVLMETLRGHSKMVEEVSFSPDSLTLASASADNTVKLWTSEGGMLKPLKGHSEPVSSVSFSPDSQILATASWDKTVKLWRPNGILIKAFPAHTKPVSSVSFSPKGQALATGSWDGTIKLWNPDGTLQKTLQGHKDRVTGISFSPNGQLIASSSTDQTVKLWSVEGRLLRTLKGHSAEVWGVSFSPDGKSIAAASEDKTVTLWNQDGKLLMTLNKHSGSVNWVSFSPDGKLIASASSDGTVNLWSWEGQLITPLKGHNGSVNWVSFSPDGKLIASASDDETVNLWSREGNLITSLEGHHDAVFGVNFSPDGKTLASFGKDTNVIVWSLDVNDLLEQGCSWLDDYLKHNLERPSDRSLCNGIYPRRT